MTSPSDFDEPEGFDLYAIHRTKKLCFAYCGDDVCDCEAGEKKLDLINSVLYDNGTIREVPATTHDTDKISDETTDNRKDT